MISELPGLTESELQKEFYRVNFTRYEIVANNMYVYNEFSECDLFAVRKSGFCDEIEIKLSVSDYKADFNKMVRLDCQDQKKHKLISSGDLLCNYFSYLMPADIADKVAIPSYCGLYIATVRHGLFYVQEIKKPPRLHSNKITLDKKYEMLKKLQYRYWRQLK